MTIVNIHEAKAHLSRLLTLVAAGEEVVIARAGKPVARLTPYDERPEVRTLGRDSGLFQVPEDFDDPLPDQVLDEFED